MESGSCGSLIYEIVFKVKNTRREEFENHCKDTMKLVEGVKGVQSVSFSRLRDAEDKEWDHFRVELVFENQERYILFRITGNSRRS